MTTPACTEYPSQLAHSGGSWNGLTTPAQADARIVIASSEAGCTLYIDGGGRAGGLGVRQAKLGEVGVM